MDFSRNLTPLIRVLLPVLFVLYVVDLALSGLITRWIAWAPLASGSFGPWQVLTTWFSGVGDPGNELLSLLGLFFLLPMAERLYPGWSLLRVWMGAWGSVCVVVFLGILSTLIRDVGVPSALPAALTFLMAIVGFRMANAQFLFMFVIPVKAVWLAWFDGLLAALFVLAYRDSSSLSMLAAWGFAYVITHIGGLDGGFIRRIRLQLKRQRISRSGGKFTVIDGGKGKPSDWVN